jgi:hypothetical protein
MRFTMLVICGLVILSLYSMPVMAEEPVKIEGIALQSLEACHVEYTEIGRRAHWSGNIVYQSVVNDNGVIADLKPLVNRERMSGLVKLDQFESCIKRWRFQDPGEYTIKFSIGTPGGNYSISVTTKGKSLKVIL